MNRFVTLCLLLVLIAVPAIRPLTAAERTPEEKRVDEAVVRALKFIAREQLPSGCWRIDTYGDSTAATSLAVMSFLAAGHVPGEGPYGEQINRGIDWVMDHQRPSGMIVERTGHGPLYDHGISTLMLAEVIGMLDKNRAQRCRETLEEAVRLILQAHDVPKARGHEGGWRYSVSSRDSDLSVTGWQLLALRAAKDVGCDVPADNIERAIEYVKMCHTRGGFTYQPGQAPTAVRTGTGILCLEVAGDHHSPEALAGAEYLLDHPLRWTDQHCFYGVYYCGVGMFKIGGESWKRTQEHITDMLLVNQLFDGSWLSDRERNYGKTYCTSMAVLALAIDYRYLPIYQR